MRLQPSEALDDQFYIDPLGCHISVCGQAVSVSFNTSRLFVSSSVHNGGTVQADHYVNLHVSDGGSVDDAGPDTAFSHFSQLRKLEGSVVGMMTAASMKSTRITTECINGETLLVILTTGLANARCAGDDAEYRELYDASPQKVGTINIFAAFSAPIHSAAMIEAHAIITEMKCSVMQERAILSPVSGKIATGTGTDAIAIASPSVTDEAQCVRFIGKHTVLGERLARTVQKALSSSLDYYTLDSTAKTDKNRILTEF